MNEENKKNRLSNTLFWSFILLVAGGVATYSLCEDSEKSEQHEAVMVSRETAVDENAYFAEAYEQCKMVISRRGAELQQSILARSSRVPELAEDLTGLEAKWEVVKAMGDEKQVNAWVSQKVEEKLYNPSETTQLVVQTAAACVADWVEVENKLARQLGRPVLGSYSQGGKVDVENIPVPEGINHELWKQIMYNLASNLGGEIATVVGTQLAVSGGILTVSAAGGWATFGISVVVGVLVDWVVGIFTDPKPELEQSLNLQLAGNAAKMRESFEASMLNVLNKRVAEWQH